MYYLLKTKPEELEDYKRELDRVLNAIESGKTPVYNELRSAKSNLVESLPFNSIYGVFAIMSAVLLSFINIPEIIKIAVVMLVNNFFGVVANYIFVYIKHVLRARLCKRLGVPFTEKIVAAMESLEYQSV